MNIALNPRRTMLPVVMLMISSPRRKSRRLAALALTVNLHIFWCHILYFLACSHLFICICIYFTYICLTECLPCWSRPPDPKPESLLAADPRLNWAFRTLKQIFVNKYDFLISEPDSQIKKLKKSNNSRSFACDKVLCTSFFRLKNAAWSSS